VKSTQEVDRKLTDAMQSYWMNFAASGDPNGAGLPVWPEYSVKTDLAMELGDRIVPMETPHKAALDFLDGVMSRR
jgi:para-nitrobenzyl esterase